MIPQKSNSYFIRMSNQVLQSLAMSLKSKGLFTDPQK